jgi:omega-6 fatty acid desaturase (delta-12 desaturase)
MGCNQTDYFIPILIKRFGKAVIEKVVYSNQEGDVMNRPDWVTNLKKYADTNAARASFQLLNTLIPYFLAISAMTLVLSFDFPVLLLLPLILVGAGFHIRIFIIFHDCAHGSFVHSRRANRILGIVTGILTFTAFEEWRKSHLIHHGTVGNIDRKGIGDIWTLTAEEYLQSSGLTRGLYRLYRNPFFLFVVAPFFLFTVMNRFPGRKRSLRENLNTLTTDAALAIIILAVSFTLGIKYYLLIQLPIIFVSSSCGLWLFYVQHQFQNVYWSRNADWDQVRAATEGSSYYRLPAVLRWFTGNIGFHHIHHLNPKIPNYRLRECQNALPELKAIPSLGILQSLKSLKLRLYDESARKMIGFSSLRRLHVNH